MRPHKRLGKADLKRRLVGTVIDGVGGGGIEQPFKLRGHSYGARGIRRIVGNHAIRHGIQVHVTLDWLTLKLIPRLRIAIRTHISPLQEELTLIAIGSSLFIEQRDDLGVGVRIVRHGFLLHHRIAVVVVDRVAALVHFGNIDRVDKARLTVLRTLVARVDRRRKDDRPVDAVIAHLIRRDLVHRGIRRALKGFTTLEGILIVFGHQSVFTIGFIVTRPADKVVLGAIPADNLSRSSYFQRNLIARVGARKKTHGIGVIQIGIDIRLDNYRAGTVDRVQLHGGVNHSVCIHHGEAVRPNDITVAGCRFSFRPAYEGIVCVRCSIDVANVIRRQWHAILKAAERIALLRELAIDIGVVQVIHHRNGRVVGHKRIGFTRLHGIGIGIAAFARRIELLYRSVGKLDLELLKLIGATSTVGIHRRRNVGAHRSHHVTFLLRIKFRRNVESRNIDARRSIKALAVQVGGVVNVIFYVYGIGILPLGNLGRVGRQVWRRLLRIARHIGVVGDIIDIFPDGRILLDLGGRNPAQELIARHGHVGIGRGSFEGQGALIRSFLTIFWFFGHFNRLINMRVVIRERRIRPVHLGLQQVTLIAPRGSPHDIIALVVEINVRGNHRANVVLLICTHYALDGIFHICPIFTIALKRPEIQAIAIIHQFGRYVQRSRSPSIA